MALGVEMRTISGIEKIVVKDVSELVGVADKLFSGQVEEARAESVDKLVQMVTGINHLTPELPHSLISIIDRNKKGLPGLLRNYNLAVFAAAVALDRGGYYGSEQALADTIRALAEFGTRAMLLALKEGPAREIYSAAQRMHRQTLTPTHI